MRSLEEPEDLPTLLSFLSLPAPFFSAPTPFSLLSNKLAFFASGFAAGFLSMSASSQVQLSSASATSAEEEVCFLALASESLSESLNLCGVAVAGGALATPEVCLESSEESQC